MSNMRHGHAHDTAGREFFGRPLAHRRIGGHGFSLRAYDPDVRVPPHQHTDSFVTIVIAGGFHETHGGRAYACAAGSVIVHEPGQRHANHFAARPTICLSVQDCGFTRAACLDSSAAIGIGSRIYREFRCPDALSTLSVEALLLELVVESERAARPEGAPSWLEEVRRLMTREFPRLLTVADLAGHVGMHPAHLARSFRRHYGQTIGEAAREMRVAFARAQLTANVPLKDIALGAGFADQSHFTRTFRRLTGMTPAAFRRQYARRVPKSADGSRQASSLA